VFLYTLLVLVQHYEVR